MRTTIFILTLFFFLTSCQSGFEPFDYGKEACAHCKMTILDKRYASEMITKKGKIYKFDDAACMKKYIKENNMSSEVKDLFVANYNDGSNSILNVRNAVFIHDDFFHTPMNGDCAAFSGLADAKSLKDSLHAKIVTWQNIN